MGPGLAAEKLNVAQQFDSNENRWIQAFLKNVSVYVLGKQELGSCFCPKYDRIVSDKLFLNGNYLWANNYFIFQSNVVFEVFNFCGEA